ncbi:hypothetical protein NEMIN01_2200 [Nematocida minor]|uniref:uncharacterized protein n=1 Tax=Nematocida minor TaxID=1912983 RepID=UPI00221FAF6A|nr:uncharacterized protein NEMIN01_2200 [Nematocida minor]KAI5192755.1 hypothetical protein NEMIN01_2200 [Nematocida minor]
MHIKSKKNTKILVVFVAIGVAFIVAIEEIIRYRVFLKDSTINSKTEELEKGNIASEVNKRQKEVPSEQAECSSKQLSLDKEKVKKEPGPDCVFNFTFIENPSTQNKEEETRQEEHTANDKFFNPLNNNNSLTDVDVFNESGAISSTSYTDTAQDLSSSSSDLDSYKYTNLSSDEESSQGCLFSSTSNRNASDLNASSKESSTDLLIPECSSSNVQTEYEKYNNRQLKYSPFIDRDIHEKYNTYDDLWIPNEAINAILSQKDWTKKTSKHLKESPEILESVNEYPEEQSFLESGENAYPFTTEYLRFAFIDSDDYK